MIGSRNQCKRGEWHMRGQQHHVWTAHAAQRDPRAGAAGWQAGQSLLTHNVESVRHCVSGTPLSFIFGRSVSVFVFLILFIQVEVQLGLILATHPLTINSNTAWPFAFELRRGDHAPRAMEPPTAPAGLRDRRALGLGVKARDVCIFSARLNEIKAGPRGRVRGGARGSEKCGAAAGAAREN